MVLNDKKINTSLRNNNKYEAQRFGSESISIRNDLLLCVQLLCVVHKTSNLQQEN